MSVINQMLRDLDAREASAQERNGLPSQLRTLPPAALSRQQNWRMLALGMAIGALSAGAAVGLFMGAGSGTASAPPPAAPVVPPPPAVAAPVQPPTASQVAAAEDNGMKLSPTLAAQSEAPPPSAVPVAIAAKPAKPTATEAAKPQPAKPQPPEDRPKSIAKVAAPAAATSESAPEPQIDKRSKGSQAHELAEAEYRKGMQAMKRNEPAAALPQFQRALEFEPTLAKARQALLSVLVGGKQWAEARQVAESGLALDPAQSGWAVILARLQFEQGDAPAAVATLDKHAAHAKSDADYQGLFAYLLQKQQRPAEAAERFKAALALRPGEARWWFGLGVALESAGNGGAAKEAYARAREIGSLPAEMAAIVEQKLR